jgi:hypothetical protein
VSLWTVFCMLVSGLRKESLVSGSSIDLCFSLLNI